jgi:PAS domain S-box-containing protein
VPGVIYQFLLCKDGTTRFPYASEGTKQLFGLPARSLQENADLALSLVHPDDIARVRATFMASARDLTKLQETVRVIHPQKGVIWIERISTPERLPNGDTLWHGFMTDVSDRVKAQDALRTSESLFRSLIDASPLSIAVVRGPEQRMIVLNHRAVETFGYTLADLPDATHWWRLAYPDPAYRDQMKSEWYRGLALASEAGTVLVMESVITCKDGKRKPIETHAAFTNDFGILVLTDLTQKKVVETELLDAKRAAEEANQAKSVFLASMSHELRTPLNSIIGFAQMLEMGAVVPLDPSQKEPIGHILGSGRHLLGLINEVLDLARIEAGRMDFSLARMTLDPAIEEAVALTRPAAEARRITMHHDCHTPMVVRGDEARIRQILLNLLSNAVKYNREGGRVDVSCITKDDRVRIVVADTGPGIPEGLRHKLFKPFQRLGAEQTDIEGTGIGLVICKKLAEAMGGDIGFDSEVGVGSRFWMELPLDPTLTDEPAATGGPATKPVMDADPVARGRVIYIEDNPVNITVMQHVFRRLPGVELLVAESAEKA